MAARVRPPGEKLMKTAARVWPPVTEMTDNTPPSNRAPSSTLQKVADTLLGRHEPAAHPATKARVVERSSALAEIRRAEVPLPARLQAGTLQLVGLEYIREVLGDDWDQRRDVVHRIVEGIFKRYLEPTDAYYRINDERFLIMRSEEHTSELQSLMRISYAVFCLKKKTPT